MFGKIIDELKMCLFFIEDILYIEQSKTGYSKTGEVYDSRRNVYCRFVPLYVNSGVRAGFALYKSKLNNVLSEHIKNIETTNIASITVQNDDRIHIQTKNSIYVLKYLGREY